MENIINKTVRIETLGCRLNQIESEAAARLFLDEGFNVKMDGVTASSAEDSETVLVIMNTCTVTQKAEQKARRLIRLILKKYENATLLVTGCYAQVGKKEIEKIDSRITVLGGQIKSRISKLPELLKNSDKNPVEFARLIESEIVLSPVKKIDFPEDSFKLATSSFIAHSRASIKIQDGCNNACSYCAIHIARGHSVSIDVQTALNRVKELEEKGQSEVVLTTVNIAQYKGKYIDSNGNEVFFNIVQLLKILLENTSKIKIRISSLYPEVVTEEFCSVISDERIQPHFHISVQSGSDSVLKLMNRVYKAEDVLRACKMLKTAKPDAFLACDIITGFPGETDEDFKQTMDLCKQCGFAWIHAFPFSERPGTPACNMKNKVPQSVSGERAKQLTEWAIEQKINYIKGFEGHKLLAVLEKKSVQEKSLIMAKPYVYHCMTENFIHGMLYSEQPLEINKIVKVKVVSPLPERIKKGGEIEALVEMI